MRNVDRGAAIVILGLLGACGGDGEGGTAAPSEEPSAGAPEPTPAQAVTFRYSPLDPAVLTRIEPLGHLNPPAHTLPTPHMYFFGHYHDDSPFPPAETRYLVYAPATGRVTSVIQPESDYKVTVEVTPTFSYFLDHILPDAGIVAGALIQAGQYLGTTSNAHGLDFGAIDMTATQTFLVPERYNSAMIRAVSPLAYYEEPLRTLLHSKVIRLGEDKDGRINYDVDGTLSGNWFLSGVPIAEGDAPENWNKQLSFVRDVRDPSVPMFAIGGQFPRYGKFAILRTAPDFAAITPASGKVAYPLYYRGGLLEEPYYYAPTALLIVQMLDARSIRVEVFDGALPDAEFTAQANIYIR